MKKYLHIFLVTILLSACVTGGKRTGIEPKQYSFAQLRGWNEANTAQGLVAFRKTCSVLSGNKIRSERIFADNRNIWQDKCARARTARSAKQFFENNFTPYLVSYNGNSRGTFTGYYETEIEASLQKNEVYKYPIYRMPDDPTLVNLSRREIENGALNGKNLEIAYARSAAALYFLHIQGSGILKLPDGKKLNIGFTAKNNKTYTSIGSYMLKEGLVPHGTADEIAAWIDAHPVSGRSIMNMNDRYVFFAIKNGGPFGSLGVELTDMSSMAVDPSHIPLGVPLWLQTTLPGTKQYFTKLMVAQDTGSDIKGPIRGDIFFGEGLYARTTAGKMKQSGSYFILLPKEINPRSYF